jgi:hypothetical protein
MQYANTISTRLTEAIMSKIQDHLKEDKKDHPDHYNRVYDIIHAELSNYFCDIL